jgi:heme-degrading monooxygenase HmoA
LNTYITYGTEEYLNQLYKESKNLEEAILLTNGDDGVLIHETIGKSYFEEGKSFEVVGTINTFEDETYGVLHYISASDEGAPLIEKKLKELLPIIKEQATGFQSGRVYKPLSNGKYILLTVWLKQSNYLLWNQSDAYKAFSELIMDEENTAQSLFSGGSFSKGYFLSKRV